MKCIIFGHDVEYAGNAFIFVYEKKLKIIHMNKEIIVQPDQGYIFLRAKFISKTSFVTLSSQPENHRHCLLQIYDLAK